MNDLVLNIYGKKMQIHSLKIPKFTDLKILYRISGIFSKMMN